MNFCNGMLPGEVDVVLSVSFCVDAAVMAVADDLERTSQISIMVVPEAAIGRLVAALACEEIQGCHKEVQPRVVKMKQKEVVLRI